MVLLFLLTISQRMWQKRVEKNLKCDDLELAVRNLRSAGLAQSKMLFKCANFARIQCFALSKTIADDYEEYRRMGKEHCRQGRCCAEFLNSLFYQTTFMKWRKRQARTNSAPLFAWRIFLKLLLTSTFGLLRWTRRAYSVLYCIGLLTLTEI